MSETAQRKHICARVGVPLCRLDRRHEAELQTAKDIYNAQMQEERQASEERFRAMYSQMVDRLAQVKERLETLRSEACCLRNLLAEEKTNFKLIEESTIKQVTHIKQEVTSQLEIQSRRVEQERQKLKNSLFEAKRLLDEERDKRKKENASWQERCNLIGQEKEDIHCKLDRQIAALQAEVQVKPGAQRVLSLTSLHAHV
mmetsp:Transcript_25583/g.63372  ORF Transcript_25583/g.63372 Transcript_25583/m.63372 type:complete len:200 (+) Transcript_25583:768-1367(+)